MSQAEFARRMGTVRQVICRLEARRFTPSIPMAARIERLTRGAVVAQDFYPEE